MLPARNDFKSNKCLDFVSLSLQTIERREWWLWICATIVTLVLTAGIITFILPGTGGLADDSVPYQLHDWIRGLVALVVMFDIYTVYQHLQLNRLRLALAEREQLFRLITEHAADMISLVGSDGRALYASPAYEKVLGYSQDELRASPGIEHIHPDDRERIVEALKRTRETGRGQQLEYRIRHKNGSWHTLESTGAAIKDSKGNVEGFVIVNRDITDRKRMEEMLVHNSLHDSLTNLPNRNLFLDRIEHALNLSKRRTEYQFAVLFIDIDEFKIINESLGHAVGDELLVQITARLSESLRDVDVMEPVAASDGNEGSSHTLSRLGGDEFSILLEDVQDPSDAVRAAEAILQRLAIPISISNVEIVVSASIGITLGSSARSGASDLLRNAEIAMHRAKHVGKGRYQLFESSMHSSVVMRLELETKLRRGIENGEMRVHYQPIVDSKTGKLARVEALSRWQTANGLVPPGEFIRAADQSGLILPINRALLREGCKQVVNWQREFPCEPPLMLTANVAAKQFMHPTLVADVQAALLESGLSPRSLELEIVETVAMGDPVRAGKVITDLKTLGVRIGIDDFGTGYSSLGRLKNLPVDSLKVDRSFVSSLDESEASLEIVRTIIHLAHSLGLDVVSEGVETEAQLELVTLLGSDLVQGYLFAKPQDPAQITIMMRESAGLVLQPQLLALSIHA